MGKQNSLLIGPSFRMETGMESLSTKTVNPGKSNCLRVEYHAESLAIKINDASE